MNVEEYIVTRVNLLMHTQDAEIIKRLEGGMSNYTYVVATEGKKYTYRVPGKFAERFVDRNVEWTTIREVQSLNLNNVTIYMELLSGEKMAEYVEGTIMSETDVVSYNKQSVEALKRLHGSSLYLQKYDAFGRLDNYERYCREQGFVHPKEYHDLRKKLEEMRCSYTHVLMVPCHCDYQPTNLVIGENRLYVLDWEYAGLNDPFYDIACYGNAGLDKAESLLATYVGHEPTSEEYKRLYFHRAFQCLQWYNVAYFKDLVGLSQDLNMDFVAVANMFKGMAEELIAKYDRL